MLIAEDLVLLAYDDESGQSDIAGSALAWTLTGALILELGLMGRIDAGAQDLVVVRDPSPTGDAILDDLLGRFAGGSSLHRAASRVFWSDPARRLLERLAERRIVRLEKDRVLGLFSKRRWPSADADHERRLRATLHRVLVGELEPDDRTTAVIALWHAMPDAPSLVSPGVTVDPARVEQVVSGPSPLRQAVQEFLTWPDAQNTAVTTAATTAATAAVTISLS